eukprot:PITA_01255
MTTIKCLSQLLQNSKQKNIAIVYLNTNALETKQIPENPINNDSVKTLSKQGRLAEAFEALYVANQGGIQTDSYTYASLLQGCIGLKALTKGNVLPSCVGKTALERGRGIHEEIIERGFDSDAFVASALVDMYAKCGSLEEARQVFDKSPVLDAVSWSAMIGGYVQNGMFEEALRLYWQMQSAGVKPNTFTFGSVLPACASLGILEDGKRVHEDIVRAGVQSDVFVGNSLVDMYAKCGSTEDARYVFDKMPNRNPISETFAGILPACANSAGLCKGMELHGIIIKIGLEADLFVGNALVDMYAKCARVEDASEVLAKMPTRDVISWNSMIAGYTQSGHFEKALKFFSQMQLTIIKPNSNTLASILPACANLAALHDGKHVHEYIFRSGYQSDVYVGSALVDMYAKCGSIDDARKVFDKMPTGDVVIWNAMIVGYAMHGYGNEAIHLFELMQCSNAKPDFVTFLGVVSACCHAGLVDDGRKYFNYMIKDYNMTPTLKHYGCMVDLLGRAGFLIEAQDMINKMPVEPDVAVWSSLLGACRIHTNIELAEYVAGRLFELDPKNASHYVVLSNIYATAGRWDDVEKVRKMMKERKVMKVPGTSWIEINKQVYAFLTGDKSHPDIDKVYAKLDSLFGQMKEARYFPDRNFALHDVEEEQKEHILCHHSEKLALAFGLMHTTPGMPIRIVKNLRVCGDCHSAIKFMSKIVEREIVVRDAIRFHHFKSGQCSCQDFW